MKLNKSTFTMAALLVAVSTSSIANDKWLGDSGDNWQEHIVSTKTRAQVIAEIKEARAQGLISDGDDSLYPRIPEAKSTLTRDAARAKAAEDARNTQRKPIGP